MINGSVTGSALNQIPLVNSTQILTASAQVPLTASTPIVTAATPALATPPVVAAATPGLVPPVVAGTPGLVASPNIINSASTFVPEEDYRLGRGILDDFRPGGYRSIVGTAVVGGAVPPVVAVAGPPVVANSGLAVSTPAVVTTPALVSTPAVASKVVNPECSLEGLMLKLKLQYSGHLM